MDKKSPVRIFRNYPYFYLLSLAMANQFCVMRPFCSTVRDVTLGLLNVSKIGCRFLVMVATWFFTVWENPRKRLHIS